MDNSFRRHCEFLSCRARYTCYLFADRLNQFPIITSITYVYLFPRVQNLWRNDRMTFVFWRETNQPLTRAQRAGGQQTSHAIAHESELSTIHYIRNYIDRQKKNNNNSFEIVIKGERPNPKTVIKISLCSKFPSIKLPKYQIKRQIYSTRT